MFTLPKAARAAAVTVAALGAVALAGPAQASTSAGDVAYGDTGTAVKCVQIALNVSNIHAGLTVDGIWGARTEDAVKHFQMVNIWRVDENGNPIYLAPDGIVGANTGDVLLDYIQSEAPGWQSTCWSALPTH